MVLDKPPRDRPDPTLAYQEMLRLRAEIEDELRPKIARLQEELGRAAVREGVTRGALDGLVTQCGGWGRVTKPDVRGAVKHGRSVAESPSPLAEAAWEVLGAAVSWRADIKGCEERGEGPMVWAVDRYRALLEGRGEG